MQPPNNDVGDLFSLPEARPRLLFHSRVGIREAYMLQIQYLSRYGLHRNLVAGV